MYRSCHHPSKSIRREFYQSTSPNFSRSPYREFCDGYVSVDSSYDLSRFTDLDDDDPDDGIPF